MSKHTPGPWWHDIDHSQGMRWGVEAKESPTHPHYVAFMPSATEADEANARLIASAPELLEALEKASVLLEVVLQAHPEYEHTGEVFMVCQAAIAKAKGEDR